jgi:hypothetical protein
MVFGRQITDAVYTYEDYDLMKIIARQSALLLNNLRLSEELMETRELAAMARVSSFVVHDLKNLTQTLSFAMDNAEEHIGDSGFQRDVMRTVRHTLGTMKQLTQKLKGLPARGHPGSRNEDVRRLTESIIQEFARAHRRARLSFQGISAWCAVDADEFRKVVVNLVQNGLDAAGEDGAIAVEVGIANERAFLKVADNGSGMSADFMERCLFKPFRSTKKNGLGIGLYQSRQIVESFGGTITATSEDGKGSAFTVELPLGARAAGAGHRENLQNRIHHRDTNEVSYRHDTEKIF